MDTQDDILIEGDKEKTFQQTEDQPSPSPPVRRQVSFNSLVQIREHLHAENMSESEIQSTWYSSEDLRIRRLRLKQRKMRLLHRSTRWSSEQHLPLPMQPKTKSTATRSHQNQTFDLSSESMVEDEQTAKIRQQLLGLGVALRRPSASLDERESQKDEIGSNDILPATSPPSDKPPHKQSLFNVHMLVKELNDMMAQTIVTSPRVNHKMASSRKYLRANLTQ